MEKCLKIKGCLYFLATERHLPYGITQCYLPPVTGERAPLKHQLDMPVLDLPTPDGWKAEFTLVVVYIPRRFTCQQSRYSNHLIVT